MADLTLAPDDTAGRESLVERMLHRRFLGEYPDPAEARARATETAGRIDARLHRVLADGDACGHVWVVPDGDDLSVADVALADAAHAAATRGLVEDLARAQGSRRLLVGVAPGDLVTEAFVAGGGYEVVATQMRLDLDHELPAEHAVALAPMDEAEFAAWSAAETESYVADRVAAGETPERARQVAEEQNAELLPDGMRTVEHHFFVGRVGGEPVGSLWLSTHRPLVFVYDVVVPEARRGRGHGSGLMRAAALWAQQRGAHAIGLHVFGHNAVARVLYDRLGYHVTEHLVARAL